MNGFDLWVVSILIVILLMTGVFTIIDKVIGNPLIIECEQQLPRDKQCKLIAVPDEGEE